MWPTYSGPARQRDAENRLISINNGAVATYIYDAQGRRVRKTVSGTVADYFYLGPEVIAEKSGANWKDYIFFAGQRIAEQTGSTSTTATFLHTDHLGSTRLCTNSSGGNAGTCDYEPFGEVQPGTTCGVPTKFRFAGMEWDDESQLYHTWFRQYDPVQGRWMGPDPLPGSLDDPQSLNRYVYVRNDPGNLVDPLGLEWFCAEWWGSFWVGEDGSLTFIEGSEFCGGGWIWFSEGGGGGGGGEDGGGGGGGGGAGGGTDGQRAVTPRYTGTFPCNTDAAGIMQQVQADFSKFANFSGSFGPFGLAHATVAFGKGPVEQGGTISISNTNLVPAVAGGTPLLTPTVLPYAINTSVTVSSTSSTSFSFTTDPGHVLRPATISFSASNAGQGQVNFSIQVNGDFAGPVEQVAYYAAGRDLENRIWANMVNNVRIACGNKP